MLLPSPFPNLESKTEDAVIRKHFDHVKSLIDSLHIQQWLEDPLVQEACTLAGFRAVQEPDDVLLFVGSCLPTRRGE